MFNSIEEFINKEWNDADFKTYESHGIEPQTLDEFECDDNLGWSHEIDGIRYYKVRVPSDLNDPDCEDFDYFTVYLNKEGEFKTV